MSKAIYVALAGLLAGQAAAAPKFTTVFPIPGFNDGANPLSALVKINGAYYGTTSSGGRPGPNAGAFGTIFKIDPATGAETILHTFTGMPDGASPGGIIAYDGLLYGTTSSGGTANAGTVFTLDPATGTETILTNFPGDPGDAGPAGALVAAGGFLFGITPTSGATEDGTIFKVDPFTGAETSLYTFGTKSADGAQPVAAMIQVGNLLYGTTELGGASGGGTIFSFDPATSTETPLYAFNGTSDGGLPAAPLLATGGLLYGTNTSGGQGTNGGFGNVFSFAPVNSTYTAIYNFKGGADGAFPEAGLIAAHGALYGSTTGFNGNGNGTVFAIDPSSGAETRLYRFTGGYDGAAPAGCLLSAAGLLVGVAQGGGFSNNGVAFTIDAAAKTETVLYNFAGTENSYGGPLLAAAGTLYGTATGAGTFGYGAIIEVNPKTGTGTVLYSFKGGPDGYFPAGALANLSGTLYGATAKGGTTNQGTLFKLDPNGTKTTLYNFVGGTDGALPESGLTLAGVTLYGATYSGGTSGSGTLYSLDPTTGSKTTLYNFTGGSDGALPWAPLTYSNRTLYGTTLNGGIKHHGAVFALNPVTNTETTLYDFKGGADSSTPFGGVISANRLLFGTTSNIGSPGPAGTIYSLDPSTDTETVLFGFASGPTGTTPLAGLLASGGKLYGTAAFGGASGNGTLFAFDPVTNTETTLHTFSAGTDSGVPQAPLTKSGPALYGTTTALDGNPGIVFKLRP